MQDLHPLIQQWLSSSQPAKPLLPNKLCRLQNPSLVFGSRFGTVTYTGGGQIGIASTAPPPPAASSRGMSKGAIAGIVIGSIVGFLIVVGALAAVNYYLFRRHFDHR